MVVVDSVQPVQGSHLPIVSHHRMGRSRQSWESKKYSSSDVTAMDDNQVNYREVLFFSIFLVAQEIDLTRSSSAESFSSVS